MSIISNDQVCYQLLWTFCIDILKICRGPPLWQNPDERESVARKQTATLVATQTAKFDPEDQILRNW